MKKTQRDNVIIGARANRCVLHYTNTNEELTVFELFMTNLRQNTAGNPSYSILIPPKKWCSSRGSQCSKWTKGLIGSTCGGSAICGQTVWGFRERQECWSFWHMDDHRRLPEWFCITFSYLALFHCYTHTFKKPVGCSSRFFLATGIKLCFHEASTQLNLSVAHHHRHLHAVNSVHVANPYLPLKTLSSGPSMSV